MRSIRKNIKATPGWAMREFLFNTQAIAWEGTTSPLNALHIYPSSDTKLSRALSLGQNRSWQNIIHPLDVARVKKHFARIKPSRTKSAQTSTTPRPPARQIEYRIIDQKGEVIWVRHAVTHAKKTTKSTTVRGIVLDIRDEKSRLDEGLRAAEALQHKIGQELHDDLCQVLSGISCLLRASKDRISAIAPAETSLFDEIDRQVNEASSRTRALSHGLFSPTLHRGTLGESLHKLSAQMHLRFAAKITLQLPQGPLSHSPEQIEHVYRIAQEAIANAIKHGRATEIIVALTDQHGTSTLTIEDNGAGLESPGHLSTAAGMGRHMMEHRASLLGGKVMLAQRPNAAGAILHLSYPTPRAVSTPPTPG